MTSPGVFFSIVNYCCIIIYDNELVCAVVQSSAAKELRIHKLNRNRFPLFGREVISLEKDKMYYL